MNTLVTVIIFTAIGFYVGWNMCKAKMDTDRLLERLNELD